ncbi:MAG: D-alanine--poly(phosphoribitol) ligase subunit 2 [Bacteroidota bacterium]
MNIEQTISTFLKENVAALNDSANFNDTTPLISSRLIDSIIALKLVSYLEETFNIEFEAHEVNQDNLDTVALIAAFVRSKLK